MFSKKLLFILALIVAGTAASVAFGIWRAHSQSTGANRNGLVLDLNFGNNNGSATAPTVFDSSGYNRHATSTAGTAPTCNNQYCHFSGGLNVIQDANVSGIFGDPTTIAIKFRPAYAADGTAHQIMGSQDGTHWMLYTQTDNQIVYYNDPMITNTAWANYAPYWKKNRTNVLVITTTTGNTKVYLNGTRILTSSMAWTPTDVKNLLIGSKVSPPSYYSGDLYYLKVWNRILTDAEVQDISTDRLTYTSSASIAASSTPDRGLVGYWTMNSNDINSTTVYDRSGQGNSGTLNNMTSANLVSGKIGQAFSFSGSNNVYISHANVPLYRFTTSFSVSTWVKLNKDYSPTGFAGLVSQYEVSGGAQGWDLGIYDNKVTMSVRGSSSIAQLDTGPNLYDNKWHHIVAIGTPTFIDVYVDGVAIPRTSGTWTPTVSTTGVFAIGSRSGLSATFFQGLIDETRIYNYALSAQEVSNLYNSSARNYVTSAPLVGLVGYWTMDANDINSTTVYDKSGNNLNGLSSDVPALFAGKIKEAKSFSVASNRVNITGKTLVAPYTVSFWFKANADGASSGYAAVALNGTTYPYFRWGYGFGQILYYGAATAFVYTAVIPNKVGTWHHFVGSIASNSDMTVNILYVDGQPSRGATAAGTATEPGTSWTIGALSDGTLPWNGFIDDVRIYNRALSAQEVSNLYNSAVRNYVR